MAAICLTGMLTNMVVMFLFIVDNSDMYTIHWVNFCLRSTNHVNPETHN